MTEGPLGNRTLSAGPEESWGVWTSWSSPAEVGTVPTPFPRVQPHQAAPHVLVLLLLLPSFFIRLESKAAHCDQLRSPLPEPPRPAYSITCQVPSLEVTPPPSLLLGPGLFSSQASPAAHAALLGTPRGLQVAGFVCSPEGLPQAAGNGRRNLVSRPGCQPPPMVGGAPLTLAPTSVPLARVSPASTPLKGSAHPSPRSRGEAGLRAQEPLDGRRFIRRSFLPDFEIPDQL